MVELRPYQLRTIEAVREAFRAGRRRPCVVLPTGGGKTASACALADATLKKGRRALWLCHRRELIDQTSASMDRIGVEHGVILAGRGAKPEAPMQIATVQTLTARGELPPADVIFIDECHHAVAATWKAVHDAYPDAHAVIGLTATPERGDRSPLGDIFDCMIAEVSVRELTEQGYLVPCEVIAPAKPQKELAQPPIDALLAHNKREDGAFRRAILFASSVEHAQKLAEEATARGLRAACVDGAMATKTREANLAAFGRGDLDLLTNVFVLTEGFDVVATEVCVLARGCQATSTYLQMVGRVLRPSPATNKTLATVVDLRGLVHVHGMPDDDRAYSLHGKAIKNASKDEPIRQCMFCGSTFRYRPACPVCGFAQKPPPPKIRRAPIARVAAASLVPESVKFNYFLGLCKQAKEAQWNPKAIGVRFSQRFGHWPRWRLPAA